MQQHDIDRLIADDRHHVWHPYASVTEPLPTYPVVAAHGVRVELADGCELIDGMASWWSAIHGYNHPALNRAATDQLAAMAHVMFGGLTHPQAVELATTLVRLTPAPLEKVFLCDSGSVSVEVAIKMALQYWLSRGHRDKRRLVALRGGYHGDTFGAMSVCDPVTGMHHLFTGQLPEQLFVARPECRYDEPFEERHIADLRATLAARHREIAAVILEPVVQGAGGMYFYSPDWLARARALCDEFDVLLIADEIATGFGRTGRLFGCEHAGISPDIMCLGKALTGGYMTLAATLCSDRVARGVCEGEGGALMHGPTFMGNPLACAVANRSIGLLLESPWSERIESIATTLREVLGAAGDIGGVADVRVLGAIGVIELEQPVDMGIIQPMFVEHGIWVRPFGRLVYVMPPFVIEDTDLRTLATCTVDVVARYLG